MKQHQHERGQVLVFIVLGFVLILGFVGLAIDGGRIYSDRRNGQNGADAASLAGGGAAAMYLEENGFYVDDWDCDNSTILYQARLEAIRVAILRAASNGFTIDDEYEDDDHGVETRCEGPAFNNGLQTDRYIDVITKITTVTDPIFIKLFYGDVVESKVEAVARIRPRQPPFFGNAIVGLNEFACSGNSTGVNVGGDLQVTIKGGGVFSNGCLGGDGSNYVAVVQDGGVAYVGEQSGTMNFEDEDGDAIVVQDVDTKLPWDYLLNIEPDCNLPATTIDSINRSMTLDPGLYCITGDDSGFAIKLAAKEFLTGDGVTIFIQKGALDISGGAVLDLKAPGENPVNNAISGLLFYILSEGKEINIEGTSTSSIAGLIFAPYSSVTLTGTADADTPINFSTQVIGKNVNLRGNVRMNVIYDPDKNWNIPTSLELAK